MKIAEFRRAVRALDKSCLDMACATKAERLQIDADFTIGRKIAALESASSEFELSTLRVSGRLSADINAADSMLNTARDVLAKWRALKAAQAPKVAAHGA